MAVGCVSTQRWNCPDEEGHTKHPTQPTSFACYGSFNHARNGIVDTVVVQCLYGGFWCKTKLLVHRTDTRTFLPPASDRSQSREFVKTERDGEGAKGENKIENIK